MGACRGQWRASNRRVNLTAKAPEKHSRGSNGDTKADVALHSRLIIWVLVLTSSG
jgi:hypothetical protein